MANTLYCRKVPLYDANGRVYAMGGISTDITERKKMEDSLKAADKFFNMSLDIMVITSNDKFIKLIIHLVRHWDIQTKNY
jgi:hypothetical protein